MPQANDSNTQLLVLDPQSKDAVTVEQICKDSHLIMALMDALEGADRRARQLSAQLIKQVAAVHPELLEPVVKRMAGALHRPEAQTRWEILEAFALLMEHDYKWCTRAFDGAEAALYDEGSGTLRRAAFVYFARLGSKSPAWQERCWPYLDEAIQCYHGDQEFADMLDALAEFASSKLKQKIRGELIERLTFDAQAEKGPYRLRAQMVIDCAEGKRTYTPRDKQSAPEVSSDADEAAHKSADSSKSSNSKNTRKSAQGAKKATRKSSSKK